MEVDEILYRWCKGYGRNRICRDLKYSKDTVSHYIHRAQVLGLSRDIFSTKTISDISQMIVNDRSGKGNSEKYQKINKHYDFIKSLIEKRYITKKQIYKLLKENHSGICFSYSSFNRYMNFKFKSKTKTTVVLHSPPGHQAQVDFGEVEKLYDPVAKTVRRAWVFVMKLSFSRSTFARIVFSQNIENWIDCHIRAFEYFGGVPFTVMIDNLKSGIIKADICDPIKNQTYQELERHYSFVVDPNIIKTPQHKGKTERAILTFKQAMSGRAFRDIDEANIFALKWCDEMDYNVVRTTGRKPVDLLPDERNHLLSLPDHRYELNKWSINTVSKDCHVVCNKEFYSVPYQYVGNKVSVCYGVKKVKIYDSKGNLIKSHYRADPDNLWCTDFNDYPPEKNAYLMANSSQYLSRAETAGEHVAEVIKQVTKNDTNVGKRKSYKLLDLVALYGNDRLNMACKRALLYGNIKLETIRNILRNDLDKKELEFDQPNDKNSTICKYKRDGEYFASNVKH